MVKPCFEKERTFDHFFFQQSGALNRRQKGQNHENK